METNWLKKEGQFLLIGYIYPEWVLKEALLGIVEQDQAGHYYISNETLGLYAVGLTREEALSDFKVTLIENYQHLEEQAGKDLDLKELFWEYRKYLEKTAPLAI